MIEWPQRLKETTGMTEKISKIKTDIQTPQYCEMIFQVLNYIPEKLER